MVPQSLPRTAVCACLHTAVSITCCLYLFSASTAGQKKPPNIKHYNVILHNGPSCNWPWLSTCCGEMISLLLFITDISGTQALWSTVSLAGRLTSWVKVVCVYISIPLKQDLGYFTLRELLIDALTGHCQEKHCSLGAQYPEQLSLFCSQISKREAASCRHWIPNSPQTPYTFTLKF